MTLAATTNRLRQFSEGWRDEERTFGTTLVRLAHICLSLVQERHSSHKAQQEMRTNRLGSSGSGQHTLAKAYTPGYKVWHLQGAWVTCGCDPSQDNMQLAARLF